jgi:hypothetical protein
MVRQLRRRWRPEARNPDSRRIAPLEDMANGRILAGSVEPFLLRFQPGARVVFIPADNVAVTRVPLRQLDPGIRRHLVPGAGHAANIRLSGIAQVTFNFAVQVCNVLRVFYPKPRGIQGWQEK